MLRIGIDFTDRIRNFIMGKRVGILANNSSRNRELESTVDIILKMKAAKEIRVLTPEHGYYGEGQAGEPVKSWKKDDLEFMSLYYGDMESEIKDMDEKMRELDTASGHENILKNIFLEDLDAFIIDLQDTGSRVYTFASTMLHLFNVAGKNGKEFLILDRPNPVTGKYMEGPLLEEGYSSFIGMLRIPLRHGLTMGEIAILYAKRNMDNIRVLKMEGWRRGMWYDETGLRWVMPSPNMPSPDTALLYQGNVMFEGTNVSEGRGTTRPFSIIGAPWINAEKLMKNLNMRSDGSYKVIETKFRPFFSKYSGEICNGVEIYVLNREKYRPIRFSIMLLQEISNYEEFNFHERYFDRVMGNSWVRENIHSMDAEEIVDRMNMDIEKFKEERENFLLYKD